jgi:hypothetical protein
MQAFSKVVMKCSIWSLLLLASKGGNQVLSVRIKGLCEVLWDFCLLKKALIRRRRKKSLILLTIEEREKWSGGGVGINLDVSESVEVVV